MGCQESRCWARPGETFPETHQEEEAEDFPTDEVERSRPTPRCLHDPPAAGLIVLDFAQRMSEDVLAQALQLCWLAEERYKELPFIDSEQDYVI